MRVSKYIHDELKNASHFAFGEAKILLFGSRVDEAQRGGDFDIAVLSNLDRDSFLKAKTQFFKYLILKDLDLPIDIIDYKSANRLLKKEIEKGVFL